MLPRLSRDAVEQGMAEEAEALISKTVALNEGRMTAVVAAFSSLLPTSWPVTPAVTALSQPPASTVAAVRLLQRAFDEIHATHPTVAFWWKDHESVFLGACRRLSALAGMVSVTSILGVPEGDPRLGWSRQSNLYRRDDRDVLTRFQAKPNIVERQDRDGGVVVWLRTSKAPWRGGPFSGTVGGFDAVSEARAAELQKHS